MKRSRYLKVFLIVILILGICFRFVNLDKKVYWTDEIYTSIRISGYSVREYRQTITDYIEQNFNNQTLTVQQLQDYLQSRPNQGLSETFEALVSRAEHPPLYYLMAHFWVQWLGNSPTVTRGLSAVLSLLAFPCIYWLCRELFAVPLTGWLAMALVAVSPLYVLYAQEARQYSLWFVAVIFSCASLLHALRVKTWQCWGLYAVAVSLALYSHLLSFFVLFSQGMYMLVTSARLKTFGAYLLATAAGVSSVIPWLLLIEEKKAPSWTVNSIALSTLLKRWAINITALFVDPQISYSKPLFDIKYGVDNSQFSWSDPLVYFVLLILILVAYAIYFLVRNAPKKTWLFIIILIGATALPLLLPDLIHGGQRSTISRYLFPCFLGIQLVVTYLLGVKITAISVKRVYLFWQIAAIALLSLGILSCAVSVQADTWWNKYTNYYDPKIAEMINQSPSAFVISSSVVRVAALSNLLNSQIQLLILEEHQLPNHISAKNIFLLQSTDKVRFYLKQKYYKVESIYPPDLLWRATK